MRTLSSLVLPLAVLLGGCTGHVARDAQTAATFFATAAFVASVASGNVPEATHECSEVEVEYVETECSCSVYRR